MEKAEILEKYGDVINAESCTEAFIFEGTLYYHYEWLNKVEMAAEDINFMLDGSDTEDPRGNIAPLGKYFKAKSKGEKIK